MNSKRIFRWLMRLVCAALVLLAMATAVVWRWVVLDQRSISYEQMVAELLNSHDPEKIEEQLRTDSRLALSLLGHDSKQVQFAARSLLRNHHVFDSATLDAIAMEMRDEGGMDREFMVKLLAESGPEGVSRLVALYRSERFIDPALQDLVGKELDRKVYTGGGMVPAFIALLSDPSLLMDRRCEVARAFRFLEPADGSSPSRYRIATLASLQEMLPILPGAVGSTLAASLQQGSDSYHRWFEAQIQRMKPPFSDLSSDGQEAIAALNDKDDWSLVGAAADALAKAGIKAAIPALQKVVDSHWYGAVRADAARAIRVLEGKEEHLATGEQRPDTIVGFAWAEVQQSRRDPALSSRSSSVLEDIVRLTKPARDAVFWRLQPTFSEVEYRVPGRLPRRLLFSSLSTTGGMRAKQAMSFAGGKLLGFDEGEFGGGAVFIRRGEMPLSFPTPNVGAFVRMPFGVLIVEANDATGQVYLAEKSPTGEVSVREFKRLPLESWYEKQLKNGDLRFGSPSGAVILTQSGEIHRAP